MAPTTPTLPLLPSACGPVFQLGDALVRAGSCSWTDPTLTRDTDWYPRRSMSAADRLAYYASRFPLVEVDSTYYFPPTPELARSWVERTPPGFRMNVKAYSLLTGHPTLPHSLWPDLAAEVRPEHQDKRRLYATHLSSEALQETWLRFRHALAPLHEGDRLGAVLLQYPEWFTPTKANREALAEARHHLSDFHVCVEFRNLRWVEGKECETTLTLLEELHLAFVCVDAPQGFTSSMPPVTAVTHDLAVVRFHGRNTATWDQPDVSVAERFRYRYNDEELREWVPRVHELAAATPEIHLLMNNCWRDSAVVNAARLTELLVESGARPVSRPS